MIGTDDDAITALCGSCVSDDGNVPPREYLSTQLATETAADPTLAIGTDEAARVVVHFCRHHGADTRTSRTMVDVLLLLQPPLASVDLWLCLAALVRRFAPVALLPGAGEALVGICRLFESLLLFHDPEIALLLKRAGVGAEMYCLPWFCTAHATGLADLLTVLHIWSAWITKGEPLDTVFLGLARLSLCRGELLLCGPVPELAQLLQASLGTQQYAREQMAAFAVRRTAELKAATPLSFLKRLQDGLLRPPPPKPPAAKPEAKPEAQSGAAEPEAPEPQRAGGEGRSGSSRGGAAGAGRGAGLAQKIGAGWGARAPAWIGGHKAEPKAFAPPPRQKVGEPISCMRVEAQDVMMIETLLERHFGKLRKKNQQAEGIESQAGGAAASDALPGDVCRLLPRLIDTRPWMETNRYGIKGVKAVDVCRKTAVADFVAWSEQRAIDVMNFGLRPMHVILTTDGTMSPEQSAFLRGTVAQNVPGLCILAGGYSALEPFFLSQIESAGLKELPATLKAVGQESKEILQKGVTGLQHLWGKAPSRHALREKLTNLPAAKGNTERQPERRGEGETFERAPLPPQDVEPFIGFSSSPVATSTTAEECYRDGGI